MAGSSEKEPVLPTHHEEHVKQKQMSRSKWGLLTLLFFTICFACLLMPWEQFKPESQAVDLTAVPQRKVALEAHIMSKCPDARDCLRDLIVPAMQNVSDKVDFSLSYIGHLNPKNADEPVTCKHGPTECLGNEIELCAADLYPNVETYLGFTLCLSESYSHIPERGLLEECALEHGLDFGKLNECLSKDDGNYAMDLLRQSVTRSESKDVIFSCTVRLNDEIRCIRDGGEWKDCPGGSSVEDLIRDIEAAGAKLGGAEIDDL